jgi:hypothetical protein
MKVKNLWVICALIILSQTLSGQPLTKIQREFFVLGTLDDYMGRRLNPDEKNLLDSYYSYEGSLVTMLDSLLKIDYSSSDYKAERYFTSDGTPASSKIFSNIISEKFNSYYRFKPSGFFTLEHDTIYWGKLKGGIFKTDAEKLAFLAGVYVRFGMRNDTAYEISIANSTSKTLICTDLLKEFNCKPTYSIWKNYIPVGHHVYFHPTEELKAYLQQYMYARKRLENSYKAIFQKMSADTGKRK